MATCNTGVVTRAVDANDCTTSYYEIIQDILEFSFAGNKELKVVFFYCDWFDPNRGTRQNQFGMVEVKHSQLLRGYDNFILAHQVEQVYYMSYPCPKLSAWWVVYKVNPHEQLHIPGDEGYRESQILDEDNFEIQQEDEMTNSFNVEIAHALDSLVGDPNDIIVPEKRKREPKKKNMRWCRPWGTRGQIDPDFDDN